MARIESTLTLLSAIIIYCSSFTGARNLDSNELSIGVWNVTMKCRRSSFTSEVFPPRVAREQPDHQTRRRQWLRPWSDASHSFDCQLSLFSNGTFALQPRDEESWTRLAGTNILSSNGYGEPHPQQPPYLAVHGRWEVQSNPYCITDRSFDEVTLASVPRIQTRITPTKEPPAEVQVVQAQQRLRLLMQCRLSGHYTNGGLARRLQGSDSYSRGRISRGVILLQDELHLAPQQGTDSNSNSKPWWQSHNKVVASFSGRRQIPPGFRLDEDDLLENEES